MILRSLPRGLALAFLVPAALLASGCGDGPKSKVSGAVTFDGQLLEDGYIQFRPTDGKGADVGGPITKGGYTLNGVPVGPKTVMITTSAPPSSSGPMSSEDASKMKAAPKKEGKVVGPTTKGNNKPIDVKAGDQIFDFALTS